MKYLALDIGSSYIKHALLDADHGRIEAAGRIPGPPPVVKSGTRFEIDPEAIWNIVEKILLEHVFRESDISGILFSTQMHGFLLADKDGSAITNYISWQDRRCMERAGDGTWMECLEKIGLQELMESSGVWLRPPVSLCNLYRLTRERDFSGMHFCTLGSWLILRLTGRNACHITKGAPTGLVDVVREEWNGALIRAVGLDGMVFPDLITGLESCGVWKTGNRKISVFPDFGDHQVCVLGTGADRESEVCVNIGTAGLVSMITGEYHRHPGDTRPFFEGKYLNTIRGLFGGRDLEVLVDFLADAVEWMAGSRCTREDAWKRVCALPEKRPDQNTGNSAPTTLRITPTFAENGIIRGITRENFHCRNLLEAVYTAAAEEYEKALFEMHTGEVKGIVFSGGAARKNLRLKTAIAEQLKAPWRETESDEVFRGLCRIAMVCSGRCKSLKETGQYLL